MPPAASTVSRTAREIEALFASPLPEHGTRLDGLIRRIADDIIPDSNWLHHPMAMGHQVAPPLPASIWTEALVGALDRDGGGALATTNRWMSGVGGDATLDQAIAEAELMLAQARLVPAGPWERGDRAAIAEITAAHRADAWLEYPWKLRIACNDHGMWQLVRTLAEQFRPLVDDLGNHNMTRARAVRVASDLLAAQGWVTFSDRWTIFPDGTAELGGWHPDQVDPSAWRAQPAT
mgnify:CR=1 FL=1